MDIRFCIKSKDRVDGLYNKTYKMLKKYGVKDSLIDIFLSTDENVEQYKEKFGKCNLIKGDLGIVGIDNFIVDYYPPQQKYIYLNDDIRDLYYAVDTHNFKRFDELDINFFDWIHKYFDLMEQMDISYGGLYPTNNPYFMRNKKQEITFSFILITDVFSFVINNKNVKLSKFYLDDDFNDNMYSDYEKSILHFEDKGKLMRLNYFCFDALYFNGRNTSNRTADRAEPCAQLMKAVYPNHITSIKHLKNGFCSLRFASNPCNQNQFRSGDK
jgi:hypothetical protein